MGTSLAWAGWLVSLAPGDGKKQKWEARYQLGIIRDALLNIKEGTSFKEKEWPRSWMARMRRSQNCENITSKDYNRLQDLRPSCKVWIGGLEAGTTRKAVQEVFKKYGRTKAALLDEGCACVAFDIAEKAKTAVAANK